MNKQHLAIIGAVNPEPNSSAAGTRLLGLINLFKDWNYKISFLTSANNKEFSYDLSELDIQTYEIEANNSEFNKLIKELNPDVVLFDRFMTEEQYSWRVMEEVPDAIRILDTIDLHFLRTAREEAVKKNIEVDLKSDVARREIASILRSDLSLIISEYEYKLLIDEFKIDADLLFYIPIFFDAVPKEFNQERKDFIFIGNFNHSPNYDAVLYLKKIWKDIRKKLPNVNLNVFGSYASEKVYNLKEPGFNICGRAANAITEIAKAKVCLAPLRFGAGIKGKLLDSMFAGTPSVTTEIGVEGMSGDLPWAGLVAENESEFVKFAVDLYQDPDLWLSCQVNGVKILEQRFMKKLFTEKLSKKISSVQNNLSAHRKNNFFGSLLLQHTTLSYKYLSKWIELKNLK